MFVNPALQSDTEVERSDLEMFHTIEPVFQVDIVELSGGNCGFPLLQTFCMP